MVIERQNNEIIIRLPESLLDIREVQRLVDYFRFMESNSQNQGTEEQAAERAKQVDTKWWQENKHRFLP